MAVSPAFSEHWSFRLAASLAGVSILVIGCARFGQDRADGGDSPIAAGAAIQGATGADAADGEWIPAAGAGADAAASRIAADAKKLWLAKGMDAERADQLGQDVSTILSAIFGPDFDKYHRLMTSHGLALDEIAGGFAAAMLEWGIYSDSAPELAADRPLEQKIRHFWSRPGERRTEWQSARPSSLMVGFGLVADANTPEWPYAGHYGQLSLYAPKAGRLMEEQGASLTKTKDTAWLSIEGRFSSGMKTRMRITFYYDGETRVWVPITAAFGTDGAHRPFPML